MTWLYVPSAFLVSPQGGAVSSEALLELSDDSASRLASSVLSRSKRMPPRLWRRAWKRAIWMRRLSGVTYERSTLERGVALWISSLRDIRANRSPSPDRGSAQMILGICSPTSRVSLPSASPRSASSKTSPAICRSEDTRSSESFKAWASMLRAHSGRRRKSALRTVASASSSSLPTPSASSYGTNQGGAAGRSGKVRPSPETMARAAMWPTPTASLGTKGGRVTPRKGREGGTLIEAVSARTAWPTPTVRGNNNRAGASERSGDGLGTAVGGPLNPTWVEWLMGWPIGWTDCACSATALCPSKPKQRSSSASQLSGSEAAE